MVLPLIGRRQELDRTRAAVLSETGRLVTLVGPGGVGKSTLARAVTANLGDCFPGGVAWVDLGPRRDLLAALDAIAIALGASNRHTFAERLAARGRTLTVLDAADGLDVARDDAFALRRRLADWLEACPDAVWLATSRRPLDLAVEQVIPLGGLNVEDAKALFERCVGARRPDLVADLDTRFVARLDGLPLAIELYASHAHLDLAEHLTSAPSTLLALKRETVDAEPRHHSLADTVAWSFDRLTLPDRNLLVRLSTVAGRFDLDLATRLSGRTLVDTVAGLERLVASSLVAEGFRLYDAVRCFAASLQDESDHERHREVLAAECEAALPDLLDGDPSRARATFERLADDLFAAHDDAFASGDLEHLVPLALALACHLSGRNGEAADAILSRALGRAMGPAESDMSGRGVVRLMNARARLRYLQGRLAEAEADTLALIECARKFGSERDQLEASLVMSAIDRESNRGERALVLCREVAAQAKGVAVLAAWAALHYGSAALMTGRVEEAHTSYLEALGAARFCGALRIETLAVTNLAFAAVERGDHETALLRFAQARDLAVRIGDPLLRTKILTREATCAVSCGDMGLAEASAMEADGLARLVGDQQATVEVHLVRAEIARLRGQSSLARTLLEEAMALAMNAGRQRTLGQVRERLDALPGVGSTSAQGTLQVGVGAYWFEPPGGPRVDLKTRPPLRRVLSYLIDLRLARPGIAATTNDLAAAGWPGERLITEAAADRVYTAIGTLRKMGLASVLIRSDGGYILEPTLPTIVV